MKTSTKGLAVLGGGALLVILSACGQSGSTGTAPPSSTAAGSATATATVNVTESEFAIDASPTSLPAGSVTFAISNTGAASHDVVVKGPGVDNVASALVSPGGTGSLTVTLQPGTYELYCNVPGHKDKGMDTTITVT